MRQFISDDRVTDYVAKRTGCTFTQDHTALGIAYDGVVTAGIVFSHFTGRDIHITVAGTPRAWTRIFLRRVGLYMFGELHCSRMSITTEQPAVVALAKRLGAKVEGTKRDAFGPGRDGVMLGLLASEWPF